MSEALENTEVEQIDPAAFEAQMLAEAQAKANDPAEQAAQIFKAYKPGFERAVDNMTKQGLQRLLKALVMSPLEDAPLAHDKEREAYFYGNTMLESKLIMQLTTISHNTEEILASYEEMQAAAQNEYVYGEEAVKLTEGDNTNESNS